MLKEFKADLHIHTCLSPCSDLRMTPSAIAKSASEKGLDIIAVTDHNSAENVPAVKKTGKNNGVTVLAGMEVTSKEEVHVLALFERYEEVQKLQEIIYAKLQPGENDEREFGEQVVVNEHNEVLSFNTRLLIGATDLRLKSVVDIIHSFGGLSIASHIDREAFGVVSQLGFIPEDVQFDALEMSPRIDREKADHIFGNFNSIPWISSSDAHSLEDIARRKTHFFIEEPSFSEVTLALKNIDGRRVEWK
jgi:PHP family Zn ribbon phosphoesterase